jgi:hypothetical protein
MKIGFLSVGLLLYTVMSFAQSNTLTCLYVSLTSSTKDITLDFIDSVLRSYGRWDGIYFADGSKPRWVVNQEQYDEAREYFNRSLPPSAPDQSRDGLRFTEYINADSMQNADTVNIHFIFNQKQIEIYNYEKLIVRRFLLMNQLTNANGLSKPGAIHLHIKNTDGTIATKWVKKFTNRKEN